MPIPVICPGCKAQFRVSDKFAGKTGPCPKCKAPIVIPAAVAEVKVHAPVAEVKDSKGRPVTQPLPRFEEVVTTQSWVLMGAGALTVLVMAWIGGKVVSESTKPLLARIGLALVSVPIVVAGYKVFRDDEAEPHQGQALWLRSSICAAIYALLWGAFAFVPNDWVQEYWSWFYITPPFLLAGAVTAFAALDLEIDSGFFHYCFYLAATILLRYLIGMGMTFAVTPAA